MNHNKTLLKSFLLFALLCMFSSSAYASEVIGPLSSSGATAPEEQSSGSGTISGSVGGSSSSGSGSSGSTSSGGTSGGGTVLGASTVAAGSPSSNSLSSDGMALQTSNKGLAVDYGTEAGASTPEATPTVTTPFDYSSAQVAAVGGISNFSAADWFWIILLILLLVGTIIYIYNRNREDNVARLG